MYNNSELRTNILLKLYIAGYGNTRNPVEYYCKSKMPCISYMNQFFTNLVNPEINIVAYISTPMDEATKERSRKYLNDYVNNNQASAPE